MEQEPWNHLGFIYLTSNSCSVCATRNLCGLKGVTSPASLEGAGWLRHCLLAARRRGEDRLLTGAPSELSWSFWRGLVGGRAARSPASCTHQFAPSTASTLSQEAESLAQTVLLFT